MLGNLREKIRFSVSLSGLTGLFALLAAVTPLSALADTAGLPPPPIIKTQDVNRVNVLTGDIQLEGPRVSIGPADQGGLSYDYFDYVQTGDRWISTIKVGTDGLYVVTLLGNVEKFVSGGGGFTPLSSSGGTLESTGPTFIYTKADGTVAVFASVSMCDLSMCTYGIIQTITYANGQKLSFTLRTTSGAFAIKSINNNLGYQIKINFACDNPMMDCYLNPGQIIAINNAIDYCDPTANSCTGLTQSWPTLSISYSATSMGTTISVTDAVGHVTKEIRPYDTTSNITIIMQRPSERQIEYKIFHCDGCDPDAYKEVRDGSSPSTSPWKYNLDRDSGGGATATITDPLGRVRKVVSNSAGNPVTEIIDNAGLHLETGYAYTSSPYPSKITYPEGNYDLYTYDSRGNITEIRNEPKPGYSGYLSTTATYASSCTSTNFRWCNKPLTITDRNGNTTTYTYADTHGGVLTETGPAVGGVQPQTRYIYEARYAWYRTSVPTGPYWGTAVWNSFTWTAGVPYVQASTPVYVLTQVSKCLSGSSCTGTAQEALTVNTYSTGSSGVPSNVQLTSSTRTNGNSTLVATTSSVYDIYGNVAHSIDANGNSTAYHYDANHQQVGAISPDPDGGGPLNFPAVRTSYDIDGRVAEVDQGYTTSQASMDSFTSLLQKTSAYQNSYFAPVTLETSYVGGSSHPVSATQYSYDQVRNPECTAIRENMSVLASLPAACSLSTTGSNGPDQIRKNSYDGANRVTTVQRGYDTSSVITEVTNSWTANSKIDWLEDANGNRSDYSYNGQDRLIELQFPSKTTPHTPSTTDYELYGYDGNGNRTELTLRSGEYLTFTYDVLNRQTVKHFPSGSPSTDVYFGYDLVGDMLYARYSSTSGSGIDYTWDALGRKTSETSYGRTVTSQYDPVGNRTHLIWPDSVDIAYVYDPLNRMAQAKQGGTVLAQYAYDDLNRVTGISRPNSTATGMSYSSTSLDWSLSQDMSGSSQDVTFSLGFTPAPQISSRTISNSAYRYSAPALSRSYTNNGLNQITDINGTSFGYDARGNLTTEGGRSFGYDLENHLTAVSGSASMTLAYDPRGRMKQTSASSTEQYLYDGDNLLAEYDTSGALLRRYVPGKGVDENLVWYEGSALSSTNWLHSDQQGSIIAASDGTGTATTYAYSPTGEPYPGWSSTAAIPIFRYTGQAALPEINLYYYKARMYDPAIGRFLQTDPVGYKDEYNLYAYVGNDPTNGGDPLGTICIKDGTICFSDVPPTGNQTIQNSPEMDQATRDNSNKVKPPAGSCCEKMGFLHGPRNGPLNFRPPGSVRTATERTRQTARSNMEAGDVSVLHGHIPPEVDRHRPDLKGTLLDQPILGRDLGDADSLTHGLTNATILDNRIVVHEVVNGVLQVRVIEGAPLSPSEQSGFQTRLDSEQNVFNGLP